MKRFLILSWTLITLCIPVSAQRLPDYDLDLEKRKDGRFYLKSTGEAFTGTASGLSFNSGEPATQEFVDGSRHGWYRGFFDEERAKVKWKVSCVDGFEHGEYLCYQENGQLHFRMFMRKGKIHGECHEFISDGRTLIYQYRNDKPKSVSLMSNKGYVTGRSPMKNGKMNGMIKGYHRYPEGKLRYKVPCVDGLKEGKYKEYSKNGKLRVRGSYANGEKEGFWVTYGKRNRIESFYKNGKQEGEFKVYNREGKLDMFCEYSGGLMHGEYRLYDRESGMLQWEGCHKSGKREGAWKEYDRQGRLKMEEEYIENIQVSFKIYDPETGVLLREGSYVTPAKRRSVEAM